MTWTAEKSLIKKLLLIDLNVIWVNDFSIIFAHFFTVLRGIHTYARRGDARWTSPRLASPLRGWARQRSPRLAYVWMPLWFVENILYIRLFGQCYSWAEFGLSSWGAKTKDDPIYGRGAKQRMIKYRLCRLYDWAQKPGYWNIENIYIHGAGWGGGVSPPGP